MEIVSHANKNLPVQESLFKVKPSSVIISSLKSIDDGKALIKKIKGQFKMQAFGIVALRVEKN